MHACDQKSEGVKAFAAGLPPTLAPSPGTPCHVVLSHAPEDGTSSHRHRHASHPPLLRVGRPYAGQLVRSPCFCSETFSQCALETLRGWAFPPQSCGSCILASGCGVPPARSPLLFSTLASRERPLLQTPSFLCRTVSQKAGLPSLSFTPGSHFLMSFD